ncbi:MAG: aminotransferase class V-fold PLP-dependent enzyme [Alphaproteobacteria bacterium]|nr:MAG: aminotransferase class V-fold PLP-dependent enzyme [Alphaproteobacteria bacterium]
MKSRIYLDHAATTPVLPVAIAAMTEAAGVIGNPASVHAGGRTANAIVERARDAVANFAGCPPDRVVFTSGGTEALALAINGCGMPRFIVSAVEHSAVLAARDDAELLPVDHDGLVDLDMLAALLSRGPALVAIQLANNETGVFQKLWDIVPMVRAAGSLLLCDAVQAATKWDLPDADFVAISAHKLGGPPGVGALIVHDPGSLGAVQRGGGQERGLRGGTPNLPGIAGFAAALQHVPDWSQADDHRWRLEKRIQEVWPAAVIHGSGAPRLPNISSIGLPGVKAGTQVMALDLAGIMVSAGAACSSGKVAASHVLAAMGLGTAAGEAIRVSLGPQTTAAEIDAFAGAWETMAHRLSSPSRGEARDARSAARVGVAGAATEDHPLPPGFARVAYPVQGEDA